MIRGDISVRNLAEFVCRTGDLYPVRRGRVVEPEEGIQRQQEAQRTRVAANPAYRAEVPVEVTFSCGGEPRNLKGRLDGLLVQPDRIVIEEFKCTADLPARADGVDRAQAWLYAGLYANAEGSAADFEIRVIYVHADTAEEIVFAETASAEQVSAHLSFTLLCYVTRIERHLTRNTARRAWADELEFPLPHYRPSQQAIARRVYRALHDAENLLLEAPTGSGKTLAVLYPALKAQGIEDQLFFLTSRNAGAHAALGAADQLDPAHAHLRVVEITAKEKTCFVEGMPCDARTCTYAQGYFDRAATAVDNVLASGFAARAVIEEIAEAHKVCPFELALDTALWADLVVGDYNYVFDPVVRLQRFAGHRDLHLLVDEAHQLHPRVRDMLGVTIDRGMVRRAKKTAGDDAANLAAVGKRVASIDRALVTLRRTHGEGEHIVPSVDALLRACGRLLDTVAEEEIELERYPELRDLYFAATRWRRSESWYRAEQFAHHITVADRDIIVTRACLDAGNYLKEVFAEHGAAVRFSGTVSPLPLYQRLHGQPDAPAERAQSPFSDEQALVLIVRDIPTYFRQRTASVPRLQQLVGEITTAQPGRYLVALPSYDFLQKIAEDFRSETARILVQTRGQTNEETQALLAEFGAADEAILFIVMGGSYGESVDFTGTRLNGTIMIGLGLPPPSLERNLMQDYFDETEGAGWGRMVAYTQPALVKNIQAAGRLIRSPDDFGVICLVDPRFTSEEVRHFFPSHWQPRVTRAKDVLQVVTQFWQNQSIQEDDGAR